jgi:hypothetical protein
MIEKRSVLSRCLVDRFASVRSRAIAVPIDDLLTTAKKEREDKFYASSTLTPTGLRS